MTRRASSAGGPPILRTPTATQLAALSYLAVAVTAVVFLAWYAAMERLGADRTGLFNGLIPIASLAAVALVGTGTVMPLWCHIQAVSVIKIIWLVSSALLTEYDPRSWVTATSSVRAPSEAVR